MDDIKAKDAFYAALGVTDVALEKAKDLAGGVRTYTGKSRDPGTFVKTTASDLRGFVLGRSGELRKRLAKGRRNATRTYTKLAKRGQTLITRVRRQAATQRAAEQTRNAQRQVKRAVKTVRKAATTAAEATVTAAQKVG